MTLHVFLTVVLTLLVIGIVYSRWSTFGVLATNEGFVSLTPDVVDSSNTKDEIVAGPSNADLNPRVPYHLLTGVLANAAVDNQDNTKLNSCACYNIDFANRIQRTGNYTQLTNNYKRANPDSCTAPFHELVNNFYAKQTL